MVHSTSRDRGALLVMVTEPAASCATTAYAQRHADRSDIKRHFALFSGLRGISGHIGGGYCFVRGSANQFLCPQSNVTQSFPNCPTDDADACDHSYPTGSSGHAIVANEWLLDIVR